MIMNPFNDQVEAMVLQCQFTAYLDFRIGADFRLFIEADNIDAKFVDIKPYFKSSVNIDKLNRRVHLISSMAVGYLNAMLDEGLVLPVSQTYTKCIKDPRVRTYDQFVYIDAQPDFENCEFKTDHEFQGIR